MTNLWQDLNHDRIFKSVEETLGAKLSNLCLKRNSYINRVYELEKLALPASGGTSRERVIVKFYRPGRWLKEMILEEHQFLRELHAKEIPVIPPLAFNEKTLFSLNNIHYAVFPKKGGRALDEFDQAGFEELGRLLARIHLVSETHKTSGRILWKPSVATKHHLEVLKKTEWVLPDFRKTLQVTIERFIEKSEALFNGHPMILLHGDCHKGNLIHRPGEGIFIVDFDDLCVGPAIQDLWMLLPGSPADCENELNWLLKGYETFRSFDRSSIRFAPALRGMRIIHFVAWLAIQSKDPDFSNHFPEAGTPRYWNEVIKDLQEMVYDKREINYPL